MVVLFADWSLNNKFSSNSGNQIGEDEVIGSV